MFRKHKYRGKAIKYPWLQHSNSAIPLDWLRMVGYGNEKRVLMSHATGHVMTDNPIWAQAYIDGLKFGFFDDVTPNAWKKCVQIVGNHNVNVYSDAQWESSFDEVDIKLPKVLRKSL